MINFQYTCVNRKSYKCLSSNSSQGGLINDDSQIKGNYLKVVIIDNNVLLEGCIHKRLKTFYSCESGQLDFMVN